jgi:hypothetical protein
MITTHTVWGKHSVNPRSNRVLLSVSKQNGALCHRAELFLELQEKSNTDRTVIIFQFKKLIPPLREACLGVSKTGASFENH